MYKISNVQEQKSDENKTKENIRYQNVPKIEKYEVGMEVREGDKKDGVPLSHFSPQARAQWYLSSHMKSFNLPDIERKNILNLVVGEKQLVELNMKLLANAALFLIKNSLVDWNNNQFERNGSKYFIDGDMKNPKEGTVSWTLKYLDPNITNDRDKYLNHKISLLRYIIWLTSLNNQD